MNKTWFTADLHFHHKLMLDPTRMRYPRPYPDVDAMDEAIVTVHNEHVHPGDRVYVLGDVTFHPDGNQTRRLLDRMHGQKYLILGNHDERNRFRDWASCFVWCRERERIKILDPDAYNGKQYIVLDHYPGASWRQRGKGSWLLHGHCHHNLQRPTLEDVAVLDCEGSLRNLPEEQRQRIRSVLQGLVCAKMLDVGWDRWQRPLEYQEIKALLVPLPTFPVDHHTVEND